MPQQSDLLAADRGRRLAAYGGAVAVFVWAFGVLDLDTASLIPGRGGLALVGEFLLHSLTPAWTSESTIHAGSATPLLPVAFDAALTTLRAAFAAMGLAAIVGVPLGLFAGSVRFTDEGVGLAPRSVRIGLAGLRGVLRLLLASLRSVHEIVWALLLLAAIGRSELTAVVAIALPAIGILGKVVAEILEEAPAAAAHASRALGATRLQTFCFVLLPRAAPDVFAYLLYRLECAVRAAAVLGFFGFPTLGLEIRQSFSATHYSEVWTFLYVLLALVIGLEFWSAAVRRRLSDR